MEPSVYFAGDQNPVKTGSSIVGRICTTSKRCNVLIEQIEGGVSLTPSTPTEPSSLPLENAERCPLHAGNDLIDLIQIRHENIRVAVSVLVRDSEGNILVTKRASHMRTFPNCWVLPGGRVDCEEDLVNAAAREVCEETGIDAEPCSLRAFCAWESAFPTTQEACLELGLLVAHDLIIFYNLQLESATPEVTCQECEVDAHVWIHESLVSDYLCGKQSEDEVAAFRNDRSEFSVSLSDLLDLYPSGNDHHGCGEAHRYALSEWARKTREMEK